MTKIRLATVCVFWIHGTIACGSSPSDPIGGVGKDQDAGTGGAASSSGGAGGRAAAGGASSGAGGAPAAGGRSGGGAGGAGAAGSGGAGDAGAGGAGGGASAGGGSGDGGGTGAGGSPADGGSVTCNPVHPNVNGTSRTCNTGFCYCSGNDGCFPATTASSCCVEAVSCGPGAVDPVATIFHPGDGETRAANVDIPFSGVASDPQDGDLTGAALVWTSSELASPIGTGLSFQAALPAGTHVITLTATDGDSNVGTDTITLTIQ